MVDLTKNKIRPFFHIKNFKDGIADAVLGRPMTQAGRSSEYVEGYEFGLTLFVWTHFKVLSDKLDVPLVGT